MSKKFGWRRVDIELKDVYANTHTLQPYQTIFPTVRRRSEEAISFKNSDAANTIQNIVVNSRLRGLFKVTNILIYDY